MGQVKKSMQQIQNELDEIHRLWAGGATDEYIMKARNIKRASFYFYKRRLCKQVGEIWAKKQESDYSMEIQICKDRLTLDRARAEHMASETRNPLWAQLSSELAVSILKLEYEGISALKNARLKQLEEKAGYIELKPTAPDVSTSEVNGLDSTTTTRTNDERQF